MLSCLFLSPESPIGLLYGAAVLIGIGAISCNQAPWSILPDVIDVGELITGKRQEGVYSGIVTFIRQSANALALGLAGLLLEFAGYAEAQANGIAALQTVGTIRALRLIFVFAPIVFIVVAFILAYRYPLTRARFASVRSACDLLRAGGRIRDDALKNDIRAVTGLDKDGRWSR
jgi:Na+/melibiose symporter-like transporter